MILMIICVCKAISDRHIRAAIKGGAACMRDLARDLGVGTCCGKCVPEARNTLSTTLNRGRESATPAHFSPANAELAA
ncbi:MAG: (2Fe-2S)-binding protein [Gammaproteobacteria bacterium]